MTKNEALKMAIEAFDNIDMSNQTNEECARAWFIEGYVQALEWPPKEALEHPSQEPVGWINVKDKLPPQEINFLSFSETFGYQVSMYSSNPLNSTGLPTLERLKITKWMPIPHITHPATSWQGLSDDEIETIMVGKNGTYFNFARAIEQALKDKNNGTT